MEKKAKKSGSTRVAAFFKKNVYYVLMALCVIAIGVMITVAVVNDGKVDDVGGGQLQKPPVPDEKPPAAFIIDLPIEEAVMGKDFVYDALVFCNTEKVWKTHGGIDFLGEVGAEVVNVFDGVVESVTTDTYEGTVITVDHENGYKSTYKLLKDSTLKAGDKVAKGDKLGVVGTGTYECNDESHIEYVLEKDGEIIDPNDYLVNADK